MKGYHSPSLPPSRELLAGYLSFIVRHRGLSPATYRQRRKALQEFLDYLQNRTISLKEVQVKDLDGFIRKAADLHMSKAYVCIRTTAIRGFFRYLYGEGWFSKDLSRAVESPRIYRDSIVPPHFTWEELRQLFASIRGETPPALRDRAMLALLCVYGLRSGEIVSLTMDDIDWTHKVLQIRNRKNGSSLILPLLPEVEAVLSHYISKGRPSQVSFRELLLNVHGQPMKNGQLLSKRLRTLVARAGLKGNRGCHAIRRTVGTHLVEQGCGVAEVALILGHTSLQSAQVYLRLSVELLRDVTDNYGEML